MSKQLSLFACNEPLVREGDASITMFFDGAARNNPGPSGVGIVVKKGHTVVAKHGFFVGQKTNNQAEYLALIIGILIVREHVMPNEQILIYGDSQLLIQQMKGLYRVKNPGLQHLFRVAHMLSSTMNVKFEHILRSENKEADAAANHGIDAHVPVPDQYKQVLHEYHITF